MLKMKYLLGVLDLWLAFLYMTVINKALPSIDNNMRKTSNQLFLSPLQSRLLVTISYVWGAGTVHRFDGRARHFEAPILTHNSDFFLYEAPRSVFTSLWALPRLTTFQETPKLSLKRWAFDISCLTINHYLFKICPRFWLAKSILIIHHNQLLITKLGRILCLTSKWRNI